MLAEPPRSGRGGSRRGGDQVPAGLPARIGTWVGAALVPAVIFAAHVFYGAAVNAPALILFACLFAILIGTLISPGARRDLDRLSPFGTLFGLFTAVVLVAVFSLTPWVPGGSQPIWEWSAGMPSSTINRSATAVEILKLLGLTVPFLIGCVYGARTGSARRLYAVVLCTGAVYALFNLVVFLGQGGVNTSGSRLSGGFDSANVAGTVFGILIVMSIAWLFGSWSRLERQSVADRLTATVPLVALVLLFLACLLLTASRGALGATCLALALFSGWVSLDSRRVRWPMIAMGAGIIVVATVVYTQGNTLFVDRFEQFAEDSSRGDLLGPHWRAFLHAPLFGYGLGTYPEVNNQIMTSQNVEALSETVVLHNVYVQWLEEAGIVGAAPMFLVLVVILGATTWRAVSRERNRTLVVGLLAASLLVLAHSSVEVSLNTPSFCALWSLLLGLGFAMSQATMRSA